MTDTRIDRSFEDADLYDPLTGLPGRLLQRAQLVHALRRATRHDTRVAVLFLDIEDFADLNERIGRELSDQVLIVLARRLQAALRDTDMTARLDGDEFVIVCEDFRSERDMAMLTRRVSDAAATPMDIGDHRIEVRVTTGSALSTGTERAGELMNAANRDMAARRAARRTGRT